MSKGRPYCVLAIALVACSGSAGVEQRVAIAPPAAVPRAGPVCDEHTWRRAVLAREIDAAVSALERPECADDEHAVVRATLAAWTGDEETALRILRHAISRAPSRSSREAFVALAARSGRCDEAAEVANGLDEAQGSGERELVLVALAPRCPTAFQGDVANVVRRLAGQFPSESTLTMARALFDPGAPVLSPAVALAAHALMARALVASSPAETEQHLGEAERAFTGSEWRGAIPSYYAAVARAARVRLETSRFETPKLESLPLVDIYAYRASVDAGLEAEETFLCTAPVWVAADAVLARWPELYARASLDRGRAIERLSEAWYRQVPRESPHAPTMFAAMPEGSSYQRAAIDAFARGFALRSTLGVSEAVQAELFAELDRVRAEDLSYCARDTLTIDVSFVRGELRAEEQPPTNPLEWLPFIPVGVINPPSAERPTVCDFCEARQIPPPRELIPPRTR